jgi:hypothetical protein
MAVYMLRCAGIAVAAAHPSLVAVLILLLLLLLLLLTAVRTLDHVGDCLACEVQQALDVEVVGSLCRGAREGQRQQHTRDTAYKHGDDVGWLAKATTFVNSRNERQPSHYDPSLHNNRSCDATKAAA